MNEPDAVARTLSLARGALSPPPEEKARVRAALGPSPWRAGAAVALPEAPGPAQSLAAPAPGVRLGARAGSLLAAAFIAAVGASFVSGYRLGQERAASAPGAAEPAPALTQPPSRPPLLEAAPERDLAASAALERAPQKAAEGRAPKRRSPPVPPAPEPSPVDELALLRRVERALRGREPALALALLAELDERFPKSALGEERRASSAMAHCQLNDPGAAERAARFLREHGSSVYADHVRVSCGLPVAGAR